MAARIASNKTREEEKLRLEQSATALLPILTQCKKDGDAFMSVHFSREEDKYQIGTTSMDAGDALIVVQSLIKNFGLSPETIAAMQSQ
jgi:hypothetical protein